MSHRHPRALPLATGLLLILASAWASAATVTFNNVANSIVRGGVYTGFYSLTIDAETLLAMCDHRYGRVVTPGSWTADIWTYADIQGGKGRFNTEPPSSWTLEKYSRAGWLFSRIGAMAPGDFAGHADIQEAIWKIMAPGYTIPSAGGQAWHTAATAGDPGIDGFDWSRIMRVATPNPLVQQSINVQEFLIPAALVPGMNTVPIPGAWALFASALAGLGWLRRRQEAPAGY